MKIKRKGSSRLNRSVHGNIILLVFVSIFAVLMLLPLIYSVSSSLKPLNELWIFRRALSWKTPHGKITRICFPC